MLELNKSLILHFLELNEKLLKWEHGFMYLSA